MGFDAVYQLIASVDIDASISITESRVLRSRVMHGSKASVAVVFPTAGF
jgi:hypothetical protein